MRGSLACAPARSDKKSKAQAIAATSARLLSTGFAAPSRDGNPRPKIACLGWRMMDLAVVVLPDLARELEKDAVALRPIPQRHLVLPLECDAPHTARVVPQERADGQRLATIAARHAPSVQLVIGQLLVVVAGCTDL